ncbi:MAG: penicillin acylase family protein [Sphingomonas sp.]
MRAALLWAALAGLVAGGTAQARDPRYSATIVRSAYGIPHVTAKDWRGIGYGVGYAYAQDNLCLIAEEFATVAGERSRFFGPKESAVLGFTPIDNLSSDVFFRAAMDLPAMRRGAHDQGPEATRLVEGYVAGYNRWLRDIGPAGVPVECRGKPWVRPIAVDDMLRLNQKQMLLASSLALAPAIAAAAPPGAPQAAAARDIGLPNRQEMGLGSNGWAFGGEVTADGKGLLVGNPHFPWNGPSRFWQMHVTLPGKIDAMGVGIAGTPLPTLGFNRDIAWTHTVTAANHFTLFQLKIDPADPTAYLIDGKSEKMRRIEVTVPMPEGTAPVVRTLYATRFGPMLALPAVGMSWTATQAFTMRDANQGNQRGLGTWVAIARARNVAEIRDAVTRTLGIPWVNTIAADRNGDVLHADVTAVPNVSLAKTKDCATPLSALAARQVVLLDGARAACDWDVAPGTPEPGLMPAADQAIYLRRDYVSNHNDSYWLSNARAPHAILSPILGPAGTAVSLRTRSGFIEIGKRLDGTDGMPGDKIDSASARAMILANHSLAADLVMDRLLALCGGKPEVAAACAALAGWDRRYDLDSRGASLFLAFWMTARSTPGLWAVPFDPADPVDTPRDVVTTGATGDKLVAALAAAADKLGKMGIALDARWGDVQFAMRGDERIPIHGGEGALGVLNVQSSEPVPGGITPRHGSSYIQVVGFDAKGPVAQAVLSYSQSPDPASPHFADQTRLYSAKSWHRLPFTPEEIEADGGSAPLRISE